MEVTLDEKTQTYGWSPRLLINDYLSNNPHDMDLYLTNISLAYFEDTGLFRPNYDKADVNYYGWRAGCPFIDKPCIQNSKPQSEEFCHYSWGCILDVFNFLISKTFEKQDPKLLEYWKWFG